MIQKGHQAPVQCLQFASDSPHHSDPDSVLIWALSGPHVQGTVLLGKLVKASSSGQPHSEIKQGVVGRGVGGGVGGTGVGAAVGVGVGAGVGGCGVGCGVGGAGVHTAGSVHCQWPESAVGGVASLGSTIAVCG